MRSLDAAGVRDVESAVATAQCPHHLAPLWSVSRTHPDLFQKLSQDPLVRTYSIYGFFPQVYRQVYEEGQRLGITFQGRARGQVAIVRNGDTGLVVKALQSQREDEIARIAGELGAGPRQSPSLPGFLTEEFVAGCFFTELPPEKVAEESIFQIGRNFGRLLARLHQQQIYYNDATLSDSSGRSHLVVLPDNSCRLIDFGVSLLLDRHPYVTMEETYKFLRTLPTFHMFSRMGVATEDMTRLLKQYQQRLAHTSREEVLSRDLRFLEEGLSLAAGSLGEGITGPFRTGFQEGYK